MTRKNMNSENKPFLLKPAAKDYLWGGSRLNDDFNYNIPVSPFAEAWVCSCHPDGESVVSASTVDDCISLSECLKKHPDWLGTHAASVNNGAFPILIKLIDAKTDLSVQVHPDDAYALKVEGELGKTEMWYVLDAKPCAELVYGFNRDVTEEQVRNAIADGSIELLLNHVPVHKGDLFFIEAGTVHAIGAGILLAEIQESSNLTYRLYDYNRVDKIGKTRPLHVNKAMEVANLKSSAAPRQSMRVLNYKNGWASELMARCKYFQVERVLLNTEVNREMVPFKTESNSFHALLVLEGCGSISGKDVFLNFLKGDCIFVPADSVDLKLHGKAHLLNISC